MQIRRFSETSAATKFDLLAISLACATVVAVGLFTIETAHGQSNAASQVSSLDAPITYDEGTIQSFAAAAAMVLSLRGHYYPRIRAAEIAGSNEKAELLFTEMREHMRAAIARSGFSESQYRTISSAAKTDELLRERINAILKGAPPARQHIKKVTRVTPKPPQVAVAPSTAAPAKPKVAPATPPIAAAETKAAAQPVDDGVRQRLEEELSSVNAERDRYRAEQLVLREKMAKLERQLSDAKTKDSALRQQITVEKKQALAEQKKAAASLEASLNEVTDLKDELASVQSRDSSLRDQLAAERARADAEQSSKEAKLAAFRREIKSLAGRLAAAQRELGSLAVELAPGALERTGATSRPFEAITPLRAQPNSIERVLAKARPQYAARQELDKEIDQIQKERVRRAAERTALRSEITELSRDLATTYQAMAALIGEPVNTAVAVVDMEIDYGNYTLDVSQETAQLFEVAPLQFKQAGRDRQTEIVPDAPFALDIGGSIDEQVAVAPADSLALESVDAAPLRLNPAPAMEIATVPASAAEPSADPIEPPTWEFADLPQADTQTIITPTPRAHEIVRDERQFNAAPNPEIAVNTDRTAQPATYRNSVGGGADAYRATDYGRAYKIWATLAESGNRSAQFHLGALYFEGRGTPANFAQAYFWLRVSAYQGDERALGLLAAAAKKLTSNQINTSENKARKWLQARSIEVTKFELDRNDLL